MVFLFFKLFIWFSPQLFCILTSCNDESILIKMYKKCQFISHQHKKKLLHKRKYSLFFIGPIRFIAFNV